MDEARSAIGRSSGTRFAFAGTVAAAVLPAFLSGAVDLGGARGMVFAGAALAYLVVGVLAEGCFDSRAAPAWRWGYFLVQTALVTTLAISGGLVGMTALCFFPLASQATVGLSMRAAAGFVALLFGLYAWVATRFSTQGASVADLLAMAAGFSFVVVFTRVAVAERNMRGRAEALSAALTEANTRLGEQAARIDELARTRERNRVAREIHDSLGHYLTTVSVQLEAARALHATEPARALAAVERAHTLAQEALVEVRRSVGALRAESEARPLAERLQELTALDAGPRVDFVVNGPPRRIGPEVEHALYRAAQEALTNVRKHAGATTVRVELDFLVAGKVAVRIADDGRGSVAAGAVVAGAGGFGLRGLRERVELLGGTCEAGPGAAGGFVVRVEVPA